MWKFDFTFNSLDDAPNLETYYWIDADYSANEYSDAKLPVKLDVTTDLPTSVVWGDTITISSLKLQMTKDSHTVTVYYAYKVKNRESFAQAVLPFNIDA